MTTDSFLDCYIIVVGTYADYTSMRTISSRSYPVKKIFYYKSSEDKTFEHENDCKTMHFEIQLPMFVIENLSTEHCERAIADNEFLKKMLIHHDMNKNIWRLHGPSL
jgi:hypothetical protein